MPLFPIALFQNKSSIRLLFAIVLAFSLLLSSVAALFAHPLGNFTINRYSRLEVSSSQIDLVYVIDMAEIPTHRVRTQIDSDGDGSISQAEEDRYLGEQTSALAANFALTVAGIPLSLDNQSIKLTFLEGQAGLPTMRIDALYRADGGLGANSIAIDYLDQNFAGQLGWQEVVIKPLAGVTLVNSNAPTQDLSNELRNYPTDLLTSPPAINSAKFEISLRGAGNMQLDNASTTQGANLGVTNAAGIGKPTDGFAELIKTEELTLVTILLALLAAFGWGAAHALSPGHGKTIVGAYLVGTRGTSGHAIFLGLTTTITHTAGVFALGLITLFLSNFILPETLYPWLGVLSGLMIVTLGFSMSWTRLKTAMGIQHAHDHDHSHDPESVMLHDHGDGHYHSHLPPTTEGAVSWRNLLALGVSGGLIPCPSALVLMLGAISLHRVGFGLLLIFIFSLGLASVLSGIGILLVRARSLFDRVPVDGRFARLLPVASALFITLVGLGITWQAFISTGVFAPQLSQIAQMF